MDKFQYKLKSITKSEVKIGVQYGKSYNERITEIRKVRNYYESNQTRT